MSTKKICLCLMIGTISVLPATVLGAIAWDGDAGDEVWDNPLNWATDVLPINEYATEEARIDNLTADFPVIAEGNFTEWDRGRIKNATVYQTGGIHRWRNYTSSYGLALFRNTATLHITGGTHYAERVILGDDFYAPAQDPPTITQDGVGIINIWGTGTFVVEPNIYPDPQSDIYQVHDLIIVDDSKIDIRDDGQLRVPADLQTKVDDYITDGKIFGIDDVRPLATVTVGDEYVVSLAIPGDFDLDGDVDVSDLGILATNYGTPTGMVWGDGDATGDEAVDVSDLGILATNYGVSLTVASSAVPEPTGLSLILGTILWVSLFRKHQRLPE